MIFWVIWIALFLALITPPLDDYLDSVMSLHMLIQIPLLVVLGYVLKGKVKWNVESYNPYGLSGLILLIGTLLFWMIPHSIDMAVLLDRVDFIMHLNLVIAGFAFGQSHILMPFPLKAALAIYSLSMLITMGITYSNYESLLCATYSLEQQKELGFYILLLSPVGFVGLIIWGGYSLNRGMAADSREK